MSGLENINDKPNMWSQLINRIDRSVSWNSGLEGRMLTLIDASIGDREQREAFKSIVRQAIRDHYNETNRTISAIVNLFTDVFDGETIKYTKTSNYPYGENDSRDSTQPQTVNDFIK